MYCLMTDFGGAAAFGDVTLQAADEAQIGVGIHENLDIEQFTQFRFRKDQNSFHQDDTARLDCERPVGAAMGGEIIDGDFGRLPIFKLLNMLMSNSFSSELGWSKLTSMRWAGGRPLRSL